ncbi:MAG: hypothetical protein AAB444_01210 [Patescibacteria group bacterium]
MSKDEAIQIIQVVPQLTQDEKDALIGQLKHETVTSEEIQNIAKTIQVAIQDIDGELDDMKTGGVKSLKGIYGEANRQIEDAAAEYTDDMTTIQKQSDAVFSQAADYLDQTTAEDVKKKME